LPGSWGCAHDVGSPCLAAHAWPCGRALVVRHFGRRAAAWRRCKCTPFPLRHFACTSALCLMRPGFILFYLWFLFLIVSFFLGGGCFLLLPVWVFFITCFFIRSLGLWEVDYKDGQPHHSGFLPGEDTPHVLATYVRRKK